MANQIILLLASLAGLSVTFGSLIWREQPMYVRAKIGLIMLFGVTAIVDTAYLIYSWALDTQSVAVPMLVAATLVGGSAYFWGVRLMSRNATVPPALRMRMTLSLILVVVAFGTCIGALCGRFSPMA